MQIQPARTDGMNMDPNDTSETETEPENVSEVLEQEDSDRPDECTSDTDSVLVDDAPVGGVDPLSNVRNLLPVHAAPKRIAGGGNLKVERRPGRQRTVERMPRLSDLEYNAVVSDEKDRFVTRDAIVRATGGKIDSPELLRKIRCEIAKEAAALLFQRVENEKYGRDTSQTSTRRIDALIKIAHIELEIAKIGPNMIDVRSEKFQIVVKLFIGFLQEAAAETLGPEALNLFFNHFETKMEHWETKAEEALR